MCERRSQARRFPAHTVNRTGTRSSVNAHRGSGYCSVSVCARLHALAQQKHTMHIWLFDSHKILSNKQPNWTYDPQHPAQAKRDCGLWVIGPSFIVHTRVYARTHVTQEGHTMRNQHTINLSHLQKEWKHPEPGKQARGATQRKRGAARWAVQQCRDVAARRSYREITRFQSKTLKMSYLSEHNPWK